MMGWALGCWAVGRFFVVWWGVGFGVGVWWLGVGWGVGPSGWGAFGVFSVWIGAGVFLKACIFHFC